MLFRTAPDDFKKEIDVVGCYIRYNGKFVLLHRQPHKTSGNQWGMPAGKVDPGETLPEAMRREIHEETGLDIPPEKIKYIDSVFVRNAGHDIHYHMFSSVLESVADVVVNPNEHQGFAWVTPREAQQLPLVHDTDECIKMSNL